MPRQISLNGLWHYTPQAWVALKSNGVREESTKDLPPPGELALPMNWQLRGLDSFDGRVHFERTLTFDGLREDEHSAWLVFRGVDYFADVWLNGHPVGSHAGYFQPFEFDVTDVLHEGENHLTVEVTCPREEPGTVWPDRKLLIKGVLSHWDCRPGSWDRQTGQKMNSGGIWNDVYLDLRPAAYLSQVRVTTRLVPREAPPGYAGGRPLPAEGPLQAIVLIDAEVIGPAAEYTLSVSLGHEPAVAEAIRLSHSGERHTLVIQVPNPRLWWTWDLGEPHLEPCAMRLEQNGRVVFEKQLEIGLREIRFDPGRGEWFLNGKRLFLRGTNIVPTLWLGEYQADMIERDIVLLREAHVNAVRVCVHVNRDEFYTACDRGGLLVWQDFALQWGYAESREFMQEAVRQIREMVRMLVNHPCVALWCCQNESSFHNKNILDPVLAEAVAAEDASRPIRPTSEFNEHSYPGWYSGHYRDYVALPGAPVLTEFGAQALPDLDSLNKMVGQDWPPDWAKLAYHDFQYAQTFHVAGVSLGKSWAEFVADSQAHQSRLLKFAIERYRQAKYTRLGGMFQFMFVDCWPSITWSVVSYARVPKPGYEVLQQGYQPVLIGLNLEPETVVLGTSDGTPQSLTLAPWVINDRQQSFQGCVYTVQVADSERRWTFKCDQPFDLPVDGILWHVPHLACPLPSDLTPGNYTLTLILEHEGQAISRNGYDLQVARRP